MLFIGTEIVQASPVAQIAYAGEIIAGLFEAKKSGRAGTAQEIPMFPPGTDGAFYSLPAYLKDRGIAGIKWTTHVRAAQPYTKPVILLNSLEDGRPLALVDGLWISGIRTGAVSLYFLKHFQLETGKKVLVCGAGHQAVWQSAALLTAFPDLECVYVWSRDPAHAAACVRRVESMTGCAAEKRMRVIEQFDAVLPECGLVVGVTSAAGPYLSKKHLENASYVHIGMNDVSPEAIRSYERIVCDDFDSGKDRSAQSLFRLYREDPSIRERVTLLEDAPEKYPPGRIMFDAFGLSIFDLGLAAAVLDFARENALGQPLDLYGI